jgi:hypothetical protein
MNKAILWTIKIVVIMTVLVLMTIGKELGMPVFIKYFIGLPIMYAVFVYNPYKNDDNEEQKLNKD